MGRSRRFASTAGDFSALFGLGFPPAPAQKALTTPPTVTRRTIMQKVRRHALPFATGRYDPKTARTRRRP